MAELPYKEIPKTELNAVLDKNLGEMRKTYDELRKTGVWFKEGFSNDTTNSMNNIVKSINENLAQLDFIQTNLNSSNNLNQEALLKKSELLKLKNEELKNQLQNLEIIQFNINNKERLINQMNINTDDQNTNIYLLFIGIILAIVILIFLVLYGIGKIDIKILSLVVIIISAIYALIYIYTYNIFFYKDALSYTSSVHSSWYLGKELKKWGDVVKSEINDFKQDLKDDWIANNCSCPIEEQQEEEEDKDEESRRRYIASIGGADSVKETPGYFYNDNSAPAQLLVPSSKTIKNLNDKIDWVDFSPTGDNIYFPLGKKFIHANTRTYNFKPTQAFYQDLFKQYTNGDSGSLVDNSTYTTNI